MIHHGHLPPSTKCSGDFTAGLYHQTSATRCSWISARPAGEGSWMCLGTCPMSSRLRVGQFIFHSDHGHLSSNKLTTVFRHTLNQQFNSVQWGRSDAAPEAASRKQALSQRWSPFLVFAYYNSCFQRKISEHSVERTKPKHVGFIYRIYSIL